MLQKMKQKIPQTITVGPAALWMIFFVVLPIGFIFLISFVQMQNKQLIYHFTLDNYKEIFSSLYISYYSESFIIAFLNTVICILIGYPVAYIIAFSPEKRRKIWTTLLMVPFYTNLIIRLNGWKTVLDKTGWLNTFLQNTEIIDAPIQIMYTRGAVILGMVYSLLPFMILPLISSIRNLDPSLLEASNDLGMNKSRTFLHVTLPLTMPGIFSGSIMVFIPTMAYFFISDVMGGAKHKMIGNVIQTQFSGAGFNWPIGAAFSVVLLILTLIMVTIYRRSGGKMDALSM